MREGIHPNYGTSQVSCACGNSFATRGTQNNVHVDICSACHPFFSGKQKLIDVAGRVERFSKRFQSTEGKTIRVKAKEKAASTTRDAKKVLSTTPRAKVKTAVDKKVKDKKAK